MFLRVTVFAKKHYFIATSLPTGAMIQWKASGGPGWFVRRPVATGSGDRPNLQTRQGAAQIPGHLLKPRATCMQRQCTPTLSQTPKRFPCSSPLPWLWQQNYIDAMLQEISWLTLELPRHGLKVQAVFLRVLAEQ
ncbi:hypothetical protein UY3_04738 [Chelonia mydas]|uniref:Uncharacterized protein n=1 Tax=Chelonia mydas TaxID=8469 RepID=M7BQI9_CHEMY|nr:hypothetical protein UY3_04738 [Chelonia mydas]